MIRSASFSASFVIPVTFSWPLFLQLTFGFLSTTLPFTRSAPFFSGLSFPSDFLFFGADFSGTLSLFDFSYTRDYDLSHFKVWIFRDKNLLFWELLVWNGKLQKTKRLQFLGDKLIRMSFFLYRLGFAIGSWVLLDYEQPTVVDED